MRPDKSFYINAKANEEDWKKKIVTPRVACSAIVESKDRNSLLFIERKYPPHGWSFPGGMMELGETIEECTIRETKEETGLDIEILGMINVMSEPRYDPRWHVVIIHLLAKEIGSTTPKGSDDALDAQWFNWKTLPEEDKWDNLTQAARDTVIDYINQRSQGKIGIR